MKTTIIALSAAALIATAPAVLAQGHQENTSLQHRCLRDYYPGSPLRPAACDTSQGLEERLSGSFRLRA